ncbi:MULTISPECIES: hypothetical protein [unclassified Micromonospora]|nr:MULTISPECIES: hypothetical protein [unclassified Micromonospora]MDM4781090.1 hypothetical protein [Micromonospora sp. b486]
MIADAPPGPILCPQPADGEGARDLPVLIDGPQRVGGRADAM